MSSTPTPVSRAIDLINVSILFCLVVLYSECCCVGACQASLLLTLWMCGWWCVLCVGGDIVHYKYTVCLYIYIFSGVLPPAELWTWICWLTSWISEGGWVGGGGSPPSIPLHIFLLCLSYLATFYITYLSGSGRFRNFFLWTSGSDSFWGSVVGGFLDLDPYSKYESIFR